MQESRTDYHYYAKGSYTGAYRLHKTETFGWANGAKAWLQQQVFYNTSTETTTACGNVAAATCSAAGDYGDASAYGHVITKTIDYVSVPDGYVSSAVALIPPGGTTNRSAIQNYTLSFYDPATRLLTREDNYERLYPSAGTVNNVLLSERHYRGDGTDYTKHLKRDTVYQIVDGSITTSEVTTYSYSENVYRDNVRVLGNLLYTLETREADRQGNYLNLTYYNTTPVDVIDQLIGTHSADPALSQVGVVSRGTLSFGDEGIAASDFADPLAGQPAQTNIKYDWTENSYQNASGAMTSKIVTSTRTSMVLTKNADGSFTKGFTEKALTRYEACLTSSCSNGIRVSMIETTTYAPDGLPATETFEVYAYSTGSDFLVRSVSYEKTSYSGQAVYALKKITFYDPAAMGSNRPIHVWESPYMNFTDYVDATGTLAFDGSISSSTMYGAPWYGSGSQIEIADWLRNFTVIDAGDVNALFQSGTISSAPAEAAPATAAASTPAEAAVSTPPAVTASTPLVMAAGAPATAAAAPAPVQALPPVVLSPASEMAATSAATATSTPGTLSDVRVEGPVDGNGSVTIKGNVSPYGSKVEYSFNSTNWYQAASATETAAGQWSERIQLPATGNNTIYFRARKGNSGSYGTATLTVAYTVPSPSSNTTTVPDNAGKITVSGYITAGQKAQISFDKVTIAGSDDSDSTVSTRRQVLLSPRARPKCMSAR